MAAAPSPSSLALAVNDLAHDLQRALPTQPTEIVNNGFTDIFTQFLSAHGQLQVALQAGVRPQPYDAEEWEELRAACSRREEAVGSLYSQLDASIRELRGTLDSCHALLSKAPAVEADARQIVAHAHRLRFSFAPLGATPGLPSAPPAPQVWDMRASTLVQLARAQQEAASQQQQQAVAAAAAAATMPDISIPAGWKPGDAIPQEFLTAMLEAGGGPAAAATAAAAAAAAPQQHTPPSAAQQQRPAAPAAGFGLSLNLDLDLGDEVAEEWSSEAYSDED